MYLDNIIIVDRTFDELMKNLQQVFQRLKLAGLELQSKNATFCSQELMSRRRRRRSMKLTLPARCHHNPNWLVITFLIRKLKSRLFEAVYGIAHDEYVVSRSTRSDE